MTDDGLAVAFISGKRSLSFSLLAFKLPAFSPTLQLNMSHKRLLTHPPGSGRRKWPFQVEAPKHQPIDGPPYLDMILLQITGYRLQITNKAYWYP